MQTRTIALAACAAGALALATQDLAGAHGGTWRGPGDLVPPGGGGGSAGGTPTGPTMPSGPDSGGRGPSDPGTGGAPAVPGRQSNTPARGPDTGFGDAALDYSQWSYWWEFNKDPYLNLKANVWSTAPVTGDDNWYLGKGQRIDQLASLRPSSEQVQGVIVPALLRALEDETSNDVITGALIALARIGETLDESGHSRLVPLFEQFLSDSNQEIAETAALSLGLLGHETAARTLLALAGDDARGRKLVGAGEVSPRTRAFAAYGLGLVGRRSTDEELRAEIVDRLALLLEEPAGATADLHVACVSSLGLVPLEAREQQVRVLLDVLRDGSRDRLTRAHAPTALARLLDPGARDAGDGSRAGLTAEVVTELESRIGRHGKEEREVVQSAVLALGELGGGGGDELEQRVREALMDAFEHHADQQTRNFSCIAIARSACRPDGSVRAGGGREATGFLSKTLSRGKSATRSWSALGLGILARGLAGEDLSRSMELVAILEAALGDEKTPSRVGAYAVAAGLAGEPACEDELLDRLRTMRDDEGRGYVAVALGLLDANAAIEPIQEIVRASKYRPELLRQAAIALGLLGDKTIAPELVGMLEQARGMASQAAIATALGFIGDRDSVEPLVAMLADRERTPLSRAFAAVALGLVADDDPLPWNSCLAEGINYRAATPTLVDPGGTGILDIR